MSAIEINANVFFWFCFFLSCLLYIFVVHISRWTTGRHAAKRQLFDDERCRLLVETLARRRRYVLFVVLCGFAVFADVCICTCIPDYCPQYWITIKPNKLFFSTNPKHFFPPPTQQKTKNKKQKTKNKKIKKCEHNIYNTLSFNLIIIQPLSRFHFLYLNNNISFL